MESNTPFPQPICEQIWNGKYRLQTPNPDIKDDVTVKDTWFRIAKACSGYDPEMYGMNYESLRQTACDQFYAILEDFKFLPAGRITAGAGSGRKVTLFNCYVMGDIPDSLDGIFDHLKEAALTMQQGGGIGYDFSPLRPKGAPVKKVDADASGPLTFMDCWDTMCRTIMSAGARRGAMMATMACDHPDIMDFIKAKQERTRLRMFNVSVLATDEFMRRVVADEEWPLCHKVAPAEPVKWNNVYQIDGKHIYQVVKARDLWNLMMDSTYNFAEPGVLFVDRINKFNNLWYVEKISATNPCGEQPLPPYGACLLGSINLTKMVNNPFEDTAGVDTKLLESTAKMAVRLLDAVIDISLFPLPQQEKEAKMKRRMGIGITGLADMLFMMGYTYGSEQAAVLSKKVMKIITVAAYEESIKLAQELGPCDVTKTMKQRRKFIESAFMIDMPEHIRKGVLDHGIRNALLTSIAPTGTISLYAGNVSSGIEPVFAGQYTRKVLEDDGVTRREELVMDYAVKLYHDRRAAKGWDKDPDLSDSGLLTAQDLDPMAHLVMQAAVQTWVDSSISKTINCPEDIAFEDLEAIYMKAWEMGCKGCTTYRPNDVTGSVLSVESEPKEEQVEGPQRDPSLPIPRLRVLNGQTYKLVWEDVNVYVTINNYFDENGKEIPFEIFISSKEMKHFQWTVALTRMMSSVFRRGGDISFVIEDLKSVFDPNGGAWVDGKYVPSFIALLGHTVEEHLNMLDGTQTADDGSDTMENHSDIPARPIQCTSCKGFNVHISGGCPVCGDCGHSKCG